MRSTLTYASVSWSADKGDLRLLEGVQCQASKYILDDYASDYKTQLSSIGLKPLCYCREYTGICFLYKCLLGFYNINITDYIALRDISQYTARSEGDPFALKANRFKNGVSGGLLF